MSRGARALHGRVVPARGLTLERIVYESADNEINASAASHGAGLRCSCWHEPHGTLGWPETSGEGQQ